MGVLYDAVKRQEAQQRAVVTKEQTNTDTIHLLCIDEMSPWTEKQADAMLARLNTERTERT